MSCLWNIFNEIKWIWLFHLNFIELVHLLSCLQLSLNEIFFTKWYQWLCFQDSLPVNINIMSNLFPCSSVVLLTFSEWDLFQQMISLTLLLRFSSCYHKLPCHVKLVQLHSFPIQFIFSFHTDCLWCNYQTKLNWYLW